MNEQENTMYIMHQSIISHLSCLEKQGFHISQDKQFWIGKFPHLSKAFLLKLTRKYPIPQSPGQEEDMYNTLSLSLAVL